MRHQSTLAHIFIDRVLQEALLTMSTFTTASDIYDKGCYIKQHTGLIHTMDDADRSGTCAEAGKKEWTYRCATTPTIYIYKHTHHSIEITKQCLTLRNSKKTLQHLTWRLCPSFELEALSPCWQWCHLQSERGCGRKGWVRSEIVSHHWWGPCSHSLA